jgi:hypothetical protein
MAWGDDVPKGDRDEPEVEAVPERIAGETALDRVRRLAVEQGRAIPPADPAPPPPGRLRVPRRVKSYEDRLDEIWGKKHGERETGEEG